MFSLFYLYVYLFLTKTRCISKGLPTNKHNVIILMSVFCVIALFIFVKLVIRNDLWQLTVSLWRLLLFSSLMLHWEVLLRCHQYRQNKPVGACCRYIVHALLVCLGMFRSVYLRVRVSVCVSVCNHLCVYVCVRVCVRDSVVIPNN